MENSNKPEVWLRGPLPGLTPWLQPVAHALLQAREEVDNLMQDFPGDLLWERPAGLASPAFHLQHLSGVLDRLFTYAKGELLSELQLAELQAESKVNPTVQTADLLQRFNNQVDKTLEQLLETPEEVLLLPRGVGRAQLPSNVLGLMVHAAEHTMRHVGQLTVTVRILTHKK